jgi:DUF4097 and DUF4098 domain-containing protein YvlB
MRTAHRVSTLAAGLILAVALLASCMDVASVEGTFDRTLKVEGPVQLELSAGSGDVHISRGSAGEVHIRGEIRAHGWSPENSEQRLKDMEANPPISQENNLIRVGGVSRRGNNASIDYAIEVPANTELHSASSSGDVEVTGIQGPANFTSGSGNISAFQIGNDVQAQAGSGDVKLSDVQGQVQVTTGSGDIDVRTAKGEIRLHSGSGDIQITEPNDNAEVETGSGDVRVDHARADLRIHTSSGEITIDGNPGASNYWDLRASTGDVTLHVAADPSFRLYAHTGSGDIDAGIPIVMEGTTEKHELRARIGDGKARVEVETSSGKITLR